MLDDNHIKVVAPHAVEQSLMSPEQIDDLVNRDFENYYSSAAASAFAAQVWLNNAWVAALCLALGVLGFPVIYLLFNNVVNVAIIGFAISGLGVSNLVPIAFSAAGNMPGMAKGVGLSVVTAMGYSGTLFAPTLFGFVVEHTGFPAIYIGTPLLLLIVLALSGLTRHADGIRGH